jgi:hypothetical protein
MGHDPHASGEFKPIETRHHYIGYHEIDVLALVFQQGPRVKPIAGLDNSVPVCFKHPRSERADDLFIVHHKNRLLAGHWSGRHLTSRVRAVRVFRERRYSTAGRLVLHIAPAMGNGPFGDKIRLRSSVR